MRKVIILFLAFLTVVLYPIVGYSAYKAISTSNCTFELKQDNRTLWKYTYPSCDEKDKKKMTEPIVAAANNRVYIGIDYYLLGINLKTGIPAERWRITGKIKSLKQLPDDSIEIHSELDYIADSPPLQITNQMKNSRLVNKVFLSNWFGGHQLSNESFLHDKLFINRLNNYNSYKPSEPIPAAEINNAIKNFERAAKNDPTNPCNLLYLGAALKFAGKDKEAKRAWNGIFSIQNLNFADYLRMSRVFEQLKEFDFADRLYDISFKDFIKTGFRPEEIKTILPVIPIYKSGGVHYENGNFDRAEHLIKIKRQFSTIDEMTITDSFAYEKWLKMKGRGEAAQQEAEFRNKYFPEQYFGFGDYHLVHKLDQYLLIFITLIIFAFPVFIVAVTCRHRKTVLEVFRGEGADNFIKRFIFRLRHPVSYIKNCSAFSYSSTAERLTFIGLFIAGTLIMFMFNIGSAKIGVIANSPITLLSSEYGHPESLAYIKSRANMSAPEGLFLTGVALHEAGEIQEAKGFYEKALQYKPKKKIEAKILNNLALIHNAHKEQDKAREMLKTALSNSSDNFMLTYNLGLFLSDKELLNKADRLDHDLFSCYQKYLPAQMIIAHPDDSELFEGFAKDFSLNPFQSLKVFFGTGSPDIFDLIFMVFFVLSYAVMGILSLVSFVFLLFNWKKPAQMQTPIVEGGKFSRCIKSAFFILTPGSAFMFRGKAFTGSVIAWLFFYSLWITFFYSMSKMFGLLSAIAIPVQLSGYFKDFDFRDIINEMTGAIWYVRFAYVFVVTAFSANAVYFFMARKKD